MVEPGLEVIQCRLHRRAAFVDRRGHGAHASELEKASGRLVLNPFGRSFRSLLPLAQAIDEISDRDREHAVHTERFAEV